MARTSDYNNGSAARQTSSLWTPNRRQLLEAGFGLAIAGGLTACSGGGGQYDGGGGNKKKEPGPAASGSLPHTTS